MILNLDLLGKNDPGGMCLLIFKQLTRELAPKDARTTKVWRDCRQAEKSETRERSHKKLENAAVSHAETG